MDRCPICGGPLKVVKDKPYEYTESGLNVRILGIPQYECEACDESFAAIPNPEQLHKVVALDICTNKKALLTPEEIVFLRKELYLKAKDLARLLGVDTATVSRWENGKTQIGEGSDRLLRAIYLSCVSDQLKTEGRCRGIIDIFSNLPADRKTIKEPHVLSLNPQEWMLSGLRACLC